MVGFLTYSLALSACFILVSSEIIIPYTLDTSASSQPASAPAPVLKSAPQSPMGNMVQMQPSQNATVSRAARSPTKDLKLTVTKNGDSTEQVVDNQQGQVVKQTVAPEGIRQTVFRNGVKITDDIVPRADPINPSSH